MADLPKIRALIVDDERLAREELKRLIAHQADLELAGEASDVDSALALVGKERPDVIFLDIEMPGGSGFELVERLQDPRPRVIFTTAYDAYAVHAFEVSALDYLLKPVSQKRFAAALEKVRRPEKTEEDDENEGSETEPVRLRETDRVYVRDDERCWFVPVKAIRLLESEGNQTRLHLEDGSPTIYRSITFLEERLPENLFMRANRSQIVNLEMISSIGPWFSGSIKVVLEGNIEVEFSRRQAQLFRERRSL